VYNTVVAAAELQQQHIGYTE